MSQIGKLFKLNWKKKEKKDSINFDGIKIFWDR